jgi:hypothetical protein
MAAPAPQLPSPLALEVAGQLAGCLGDCGSAAVAVCSKSKQCYRCSPVVGVQLGCLRVCGRRRIRVAQQRLRSRATVSMLPVNTDQQLYQGCVVDRVV